MRVPIKFKMLLFLVIAFQFLCCVPVLAKDADNLITFSGGDNGSIYVDRILYYAFKELGYNFSIVLQDINSASNMADSGLTDGLLQSASGLEKTYPNLIMVPVPISETSFVAWTKDKSPLRIGSWSDLDGKKIGVVSTSTYIDHNLPAHIVSKSRFASMEELKNALLNDTIDVAIFMQFDEKGYFMPDGIVNQGKIDAIKTYSYVHKKNADLVPALEKTLRKMNEDGITQKILNSTFNIGDSQKSVVLSISSFSSDVLWERQLQDGFRAKYEEDIPFELYNVSINALRLRNDQFYRKSIANIIRRDFINKVPSVIIVSDDEAFEFVKEYYDTTFNGAPVVFCAVNDFTPERIKGFEGVFTGVAEKIAAKDTVDEMLKLYPDTKKLFVVTDYTISGKHWRSDLEKQLAAYKGVVDIEFNENLPFDQLVAKVKQLEKGTLMLCGFYLVDGEGKYQILTESQKAFYEASSVPIFGLYYPTYGQGQLGGKYSVAEAHVGRVREIVKQLLMGVPVSAIPVVTDVDKDYPWIFEYNTMVDQHIKKSDLPVGAIITNEKPSFFEANKSGLIVASFVLALLVITFLFIFSRIQKKQYLVLAETQKSLHTAEEMLQKEAEISNVKEQQHLLLMKLQADLQSVLDSLPVGVIVRSLDHFLPLYANTAYAKMFGFSSVDETFSHQELDLSPQFQPNGEASADLFTQYTKHVSHVDETHSCEWQFCLPNGELLDVRKISRKIFYDGDYAIVTIMQDITADKKQRELLLITAEKEKEANRMKSKFVVNISHEIRTPMNAIIGLTEIALMKNFDHEATDAFRKVNSSAKNLLSIINDVLDFSKIEAEKLELFEEEFLLEETISNAALVASQRIEKKPVEMIINLNLRLDSGLPNAVVGDKTRLWQIFKNLLDNSAKFTNEGMILFDAYCQAQEDANGKTAIAFVVKDTGLGMTPAQLERMYDSFEQFHKNQTNMSTGTGLGMAITKQLVSLMGGSIQVESQVGVGTTTTVIIPLVVVHERGVLKQRILDYNLSGYPFILAARASTFVEVARELLTVAGSSPTYVSHKDEVLNLVNTIVTENERPLTVILSSNLGDPVVVDIAKTIRASAPQVILLLITANDSILTPSEIHDAGFDGTIANPCVPTEFFQKISNALDIKQAPIDTDARSMFQGASVLVAEDNMINQEVIQCILESFGIDPIVVDNGQEALEALEKQTFDLVLMDLLMPVMDGHVATTRIRASDTAYKDVPIVALTANVIKEEIDACLAEGMNGHIGKPIDMYTLEVQLNKWLSAYVVQP